MNPRTPLSFSTSAPLQIISLYRSLPDFLSSFHMVLTTGHREKTTTLIAKLLPALRLPPYEQQNLAAITFKISTANPYQILLVNFMQFPKSSLNIS
jgi:hypothetical protein